MSEAEMFWKAQSIFFPDFIWSHFANRQKKSMIIFIRTDFVFEGK